MPRSSAPTPLEIVRRAYREPTAVLAAAGIPPVERDEFAERAWPDDTYGLVVHGLGDLGDDDLAPLQMAWGMAKAKVLRAAPSADADASCRHDLRCMPVLSVCSLTARRRRSRVGGGRARCGSTRATPRGC